MPASTGLTSQKKEPHSLPVRWFPSIHYHFWKSGNREMDGEDKMLRRIVCGTGYPPFVAAMSDLYLDIIRAAQK
jgi:hypothetical protein